VQPSNLSRYVSLVRIGSIVFCVQIRGHHTERQVQPPRRLRGVKQQAASPRSTRVKETITPLSATCPGGLLDIRPAS